MRSDGTGTIEINESKVIRIYKVGEKAEPETCEGSCKRQGRSHTHIRKCPGGNQCAEIIYKNFAKHSLKKWEPFPE